MDRDVVLAGVVEALVEHLGISDSRITPEAHLGDDLGADSLDSLELAMIFEDRFLIDIPDHVCAEVNRVGDIVNYLHSRLN